MQAGRRTAEIVHRVEERLGQYASELSETHAQVALASALLQPEPLPAEVQLTLVADSSACEYAQHLAWVSEGYDRGGCFNLGMELRS